MPASVTTYTVAKTCACCGVLFMTEVSYSMDHLANITIIKAAEPECPACAEWAGIELLCAHLMHNLEVKRA